MVVTVRKLSDPAWEAVYVGLAPAQAVIAAHEQAQGNGAPWTYPRPHPLYRRTLHGHSCGDFWARNRSEA